MYYERLKRSHNRKAFDCGVESLNHFLKNVAREEADRDLGATYIATEDGSTIAGYYTITLSVVLGSLFPPPPSLTPMRPIPVMLIGKLAVDRSLHGKRFGESLLFQALSNCQEVADIAGAHAVVVDALPHAVNFYKKYGFQALIDNEEHLFLRMKTIRALHLNEHQPGESIATVLPPS